MRNLRNGSRQYGRLRSNSWRIERRLVRCWGGGLAKWLEALEEKVVGTRMVCNLGVILMAGSDPDTVS